MIIVFQITVLILLLKKCKLLNIENSYLETKSFQKIASITITEFTIYLKFFKTFEEYYPFSNSSLLPDIEVIPSISYQKLMLLIDRFGDVKDNATDTLYQLRQDL